MSMLSLRGHVILMRRRNRKMNGATLTTWQGPLDFGLLQLSPGFSIYSSNGLVGSQVRLHPQRPTSQEQVSNIPLKSYANEKCLLIVNVA